MSSFYEALPLCVNRDFKARKREFKKGKPCAICGKRLPLSQMMVAHKIPVRDLSDWEALYDTSNWEVRCIECERKHNQMEDRRGGAHLSV